ncbi:MAG: hypothetical protein Q8P11_02315 [bacterium]|nr:hypothetical protein [bacterium]
MQLRRIQIPLPQLNHPRRPFTRRQWFKISAYVATILPSIIFLVVVYFIWFSSYFVIDYIDITGANGLDMTGVRRVIFSQMTGYRYHLFPKKNIWFFDSESARHAIWEEYAISELSIEKKKPNSLKINVFEEPFQSIWYSQGKYYKMDGRGIIIKEVDHELLRDIPYPLPHAGINGGVVPIKRPPKLNALKAPELLFIQDVDGSAVESGNSVLSSNVVQAIGDVRSKLALQQISIYYVITKLQEHDMEVFTTEGWGIKLNVFEHVDAQIEHLREVLTQKIKEDRFMLDYIDVRFDNRIYFKTK